MNKLFSTKNFTLLLSICYFLFCDISPVLAESSYQPQNKFISYTQIGQGEPLILIHAFPTDKQLWLPQQEQLKKHFRVITLDLWGFGYSSPADGQAITMTDYADEINQLMDQLRIKKAIIGGESMGGYVALAFLEKYPDKIDGLILSDTQSIADSPDMKIKREATALDVLEHGSAKLISDFVPKALSPHAPESLKSALKHILDTQNAAAIASALRGMALRNDTSYLLANSVLPILILTGDEDTLISPQQSHNMHLLAKNSKLIVLADAAHLSNLDQPEQWSRAVIEMFDSLKTLNLSYSCHNPQVIYDSCRIEHLESSDANPMALHLRGSSRAD